MRRGCRLILATLGLFLALATLPARAEWPFRVDDPWLVGLYRWEWTYGLEANTGTWETIRTHRTELKPYLGFDYGLTPKSEIGVSWFIYDYNSTGPKGVGDANLHFKHLFFDATPSRPDIAVDFRVKIPLASRANGLGSGKPDLGLIGLCGWKGGRWATTLRAGYTITGASNENDVFDLGISTRYHAAYNVRLLGEIYLGGNEKAGQTQRIFVSGGAGYEFTPQAEASVMFSAGCSASTPDLSIRAGIRTWL